MSKKRNWMTGLAGALALTCLSWAPAHAGVFVNIGVPLPVYGPYYHRHYYYGPRVYVTAPPVVIAPASTYPAPPPGVVYVPAYQTVPATTPATVNPGP